MRKSIIPHASLSPDRPAADWLDLGRIARAEVTSEDEGFPVEAALTPGDGPGGWRASGPGEQVLRVVFDEPTAVRRVRLVFRECQAARTQEFVLRWSGDGGRSYRDVVRQQFNFSPPETVEEVEEYAVELEKGTALELRLVPDVSGGAVRASLSELRLG